jgi:uncharacterized membrane protein
MEIFVTIASLFVLGSVLGWGIEVLFRRLFTAKKWVNPGFMVGPYLPLYGFGTIALYGLSNIDLSLIGLDKNNPWTWVIQILAIGILMTLIEYLTGLIFIKGLKIKLWDYSNRWGNIQGIICPLFSLLWLVIGALYFFFINPFIVQWLSWLATNTIYYFFIGIVGGMMIVDLCYSIHLATLINKAAKKSGITVSIDHLKDSISEKQNALTNKIKEKKANFLFGFRSNQSVKEDVEDYSKSEYYTDKEKSSDLKTKAKHDNRLLRKLEKLKAKQAKKKEKKDNKKNSD